MRRETASLHAVRALQKGMCWLSTTPSQCATIRGGAHCSQTATRGTGVFFGRRASTPTAPARAVCTAHTVRAASSSTSLQIPAPIYAPSDTRCAAQFDDPLQALDLPRP